MLQEVYFSGIILMAIVAWAAMHSCEPRHSAFERDQPRKIKSFTTHEFKEEKEDQ